MSSEFPSLERLRCQAMNLASPSKYCQAMKAHINQVISIITPNRCECQVAAEKTKRKTVELMRLISIKSSIRADLTHGHLIEKDHTQIKTHAKPSQKMLDPSAFPILVTLQTLSDDFSPAKQSIVEERSPGIRRLTQ